MTNILIFLVITPLAVLVPAASFEYEGSFCNKIMSTTFNMSDLVKLYNGTLDDAIVGDDVNSILNTYPNSSSNYVLFAYQKDNFPDTLVLGYVTTISNLAIAMGSMSSPAGCLPANGVECDRGKYCFYLADGYSVGFTSDANNLIDIEDGYDTKDFPSDQMRLSWAINGLGGVRAGASENSPGYSKIVYIFICKAYNPNGACKTCISGFYLSSGRCYACSKQCASCYTTGADNCISCSNDFSLFSSNIPYICLTNLNCIDLHCAWCYDSISTGQCMICLPGYIINGTTMACIKCPSPCDACLSNSIANCSTCLPTNYLNGSECLSCHTSCQTCFGGASNNCILCSLSYSSGIAVGTYNCTSNSCASNCHICVSSLATECIQCEEYFSIDLVPGSCAPCLSPCADCSFNTTTCKTCIEGYYINATICLACSSNCVNCTSHGYNMCISCKTNFNVAITGFMCTAASSNCYDSTYCLNCLGTGEYECAKCIDSYTLYSSSAPSKCVPCPNYCQDCLLNDNLACTSCQQHYFLQSGACLICHDACLTCYGESANMCSLCSASFSSDHIFGEYNCTSSTLCESNCDVCIRLSTSTPSSGHCLECHVGYFLASGNYPDVCSICPTNCSGCLNTTFCTSCETGYYFYKFLCLQCSPPCASCSAEGTDKCLTCSTGYNSGAKGIFLCTKDSCTTNCGYCIGDGVSDCVECNQYYSLTNSTLPNSCQACLSPCLECRANPVAPAQVMCLSCLDHYYFSGNICLQCHLACDNCSVGGPFGCDTCNALYSYGTYLGFPCVSTTCNATSNCAKCIGPATSDCIECQSTYYLLNSTIQNSCQKCPSPCLTCPTGAAICYDCLDGYYYSSGQCLPCHLACLKCVASGADNCVINSCNAGMVYTPSSSPYICLYNSACEAGCQLCVGPGPGACIDCQNGFALNSLNLPSSCVICPFPCNYCSISDNLYCISCKDGYYLNGSICRICHPSCQSCISDGADKCLACNGLPYVNTYPTFSPYRCTMANENCSSHCLYCIGAAITDCLKCAPTYALNGSFPNKCLLCPSPCYECSFPNTLQCTSCISHYYLSSNECKICHVSCLNCTSPNSQNCISCAINYAFNNLYSNYCVSTSVCSSECTVCMGPGSPQCLVCKNNYYMNGAAPSACLPCSNPCLNCIISNTICLSCTIGYVLVGNGCPQCHSSCFNCTNNIYPLSCDQCANLFTKKNGYCSYNSLHAECKYAVGPNSEDCVECNQNFYQSSKPSICSQCTSPCYSCIGGGSNSCMTCIPHYYLAGVGPINCLKCHSSCNNCTNGSPTSCIDCADGYFMRSPNALVCTHDIDCPIYCKYCYSSEPSACIECLSTYIFDGFKNCRSNSCYTNCESCNNNTIVGCYSCYSPFYFNTGNMCVTDINCGANCWECLLSHEDSKCTLCTTSNGIGYFLYQGLSISYCVSDISCALNCHYCLDSSSEGCIECNAGYPFMSLNDRRCVTQSDCSSNCDYCLVKNNPAQCVSCQLGYSLFNDSNPSYCSHSLDCAINCSLCIGPTIEECLICNDGFFFYNSRCVTNLSCGENCDFCFEQNGNSKCVKCKDGYGLYRGEEISYCTTQLCDITLHCLYCINNSTIGCIECAQSYHFYSDEFQLCIMEQCYRNCKYCFSDSLFMCMECSDSSMSLFSSVPSLCGFTNCHPNCKFCLSNESYDCALCKEGYMLYNNEFPSYCSTQSSCQDLCLSCLNESSCIKCKNGAYLETNGKCRMNCKPGYLFHFDSPYCREICGDGKNMGEYECDDGNIIDGDGCDHNCKKEENAICKLEGLHNSCLLPNYSIKFEEGMYKFKILFNYDIANMSELINYLKVSINQLSAIPIQSIQQINDSCLDVSLYLDNISTTSTDELSISFPNIPRYINGNQSIGTNILTTKAMTLSKSRNGYESQVVVYTFNTGLYHTLLY